MIAKPKAIARFKERLREQTRRTRGISLTQMVTQICEPLNRGYAVDFGRRCGSNGNRDGRDFANFANGM
jgi:hypothetical protein